MKTKIDHSIVAIMDNDRILGTGFVIGRRHIITCAHVLEGANYKPSDNVKIRFERHKNIFEFAQIATDYWKPSDKDLCILVLNNSIPKGVISLPFHPGTELDGLKFRCFGYPALGNIQGAWATGEVKGLIRDNEGNSLVQIASSELAKGMSGAPICESVSNQVIGILTGIYHPDASSKHRDTAFALSTEYVHQFYGNIIQQLVPKIRESPDNLPIHDNIFVDRTEEKNYCLARLQKYHHVAISGLGGCGKSSLALEIAHEIKSVLNLDGVLWLDMKYGPVKTDDVINKLGGLLGYSALFSLDSEQKIKLAEQLLSDLKILFVADNFSSENQDLLNWFTGLPAGCMVLYTTRENLQNAKIHSVNLDGLSKKYSKALISNETIRLDRTDLSKFSKTIAESSYPYTQGLPLAMKWIVSQLGVANTELDKVINYLSQGKADIFYELFYTTYDHLSPSAKYILLSLSTFKAPVSSSILEFLVKDEEYIALAIPMPNK